MDSKKTEIISIKNIKPSSQTPSHLRTFKLSFPDQITPSFYPNQTFFYPYNNIGVDAGDHPHDLSEYFCSKSKLLQKALSETLTLFYPFAGRLRDESSITCNDEGVAFTESQTNYRLDEILTKPDFDLIYSEIVSTNYREAMEVSQGALLLFNFVMFRCGGAAVSVAESHKVFDFSSLMTFFKSLSAACCGSELSVPDFHTAPARFPSREMTNTSFFETPRQSNPDKCVLRKSCTRSFSFTSSKIQELKTIAANSLKKDGDESDIYLSRVTVVMAFIWQCLATSQTSLFRPTLMFQAANLRPRIQPPLSGNVVGNFSFLYATDIVQQENDVQLKELIKKLLNLRVSIAERAKGLDAEEMMLVTREVQEVLGNGDDLRLYICTSWYRFEFYDIDFGMGNPVWMTTVSPEFQANCVYLMDTKEEGGIEALISLEEKEMEALECHKELLQFAVSKRIDM